MIFKKTKSRLLEGALIGAALGVAAGMLFAPESGKKLRKDIRKKLVDFHTYISPKLKELKTMTESQYNAFMKTAIEGYSKVKKLSAEEADELSQYTREFWKRLREHF